MIVPFGASRDPSQRCFGDFQGRLAPTCHGSRPICPLKYIVWLKAKVLWQPKQVNQKICRGLVILGRPDPIHVFHHGVPYGVTGFASRHDAFLWFGVLPSMGQIAALRILLRGCSQSSGSGWFPP